MYKYGKFLNSMILGWQYSNFRFWGGNFLISIFCSAKFFFSIKYIVPRATSDLVIMLCKLCLYLNIVGLHSWSNK
jgi:hypothetical protein